MSWFSGLADKAESLLDKMDQAAATSLQGVGLSPSSHRNSNPLDSQPILAYEPTAQPPSKPALEVDSGAKVAQQLIGSASGAKLLTRPKPTPPIKSASTTSIVSTDQSKPHSTSFLGPKSKEPTVSDESLFEFLNSPSKQPVQSSSRRVKHTVPRVPPTKTHPNPPLSPVKVQPSVVAASEGRTTQTNTVSTQPKEDGMQDKEEEPNVEETDAPPSFSAIPDSQERPDVAKEDIGMKDAEDSKPQGAPESASLPQTLEQPQVIALQQKVSNLELENKLLKREVASLNDELGLMMGRVRDAGESVSQYESEIVALREHASRSDHMIRQMRSQEEDLQAALEARDSQIQVLRSRFSEADSAVEEMKQQITSSHREKEKLLQDASLSSNVHNHALDSLKAQLQQAETLLERHREATSTMKAEFAERESQLQSEQLQLSEALSAQQRQLTLQQAKATEYQTALQSAHRELQLLRKDHDDYKQRAAGILQAKERLISSLQGGGEGDERRKGGSAQEAKLEEARLEKEHLEAQLQSAHQQLENVRADMQELEDHHTSELDQLLEQVRVSEGTLDEERRAHAATQDELSRASQELEEALEEARRERVSHITQLKEKESELETLRAKLSAAPGKAELESRLHELTESLIQKQTTLETLSSEKSSLNVQLQRMKSELSEAKKIYPHRTSQTVVNGLESVESEAARMRSVTPILPSVDSNGHLHNVRRAVNSVDRVSIWLGVYLRRYPYARLFAILYMVLLHIWIMVILLTYTPEIHDTKSL